MPQIMYGGVSFLAGFLSSRSKGVVLRTLQEHLMYAETGLQASFGSSLVIYSISGYTFRSLLIWIHTEYRDIPCYESRNY